MHRIMPDNSTFDLRTPLFVPGNDERKLRKALDSDTEVIIIDLEDSVPESEKRSARRIAADVLAGSRTRAVFVRVNPVRSGLLQQDLDAVAGRADALVIPKAQPDDFPSLASPLVALVETARGVRGSYELASRPGVLALMLGTVDLCRELGIGVDETSGLLGIRTQLVVDSAAAGVASPIDGVHVKIHDHDGLRDAALHARALGFGGKACVHPRQLGVVREVFVHDPIEIARARRVIAAYEAALESGRGVVSLDGEMIDLPVVARAREFLIQVEGQ